jgi:catechol 2,3-dioxygenase-like lactoylglutathione lyase family enzyme
VSSIAGYTSLMNKIVGLDLVGCTVGNVPASVEFYRDKLGLVPNMVHEQGAEFIMADGNTFGLYNPGDGSPPHASVMFRVNDAKAAVGEFRSRGFQISEPMDTTVCNMAFGQDPDGNNIIIHQRHKQDETPAPAYTRTPTSINGIDITTYFTRDPKRSIAFYRDVLGMAPTWTDEEHGAEFTLEDGTTFGVWMPEESDRAVVPGGGFMFAVDDPHAKVAELRAKGVQITDVDETPACHMAFTQDPEGNAVIIHKRKA